MSVISGFHLGISPWGGAGKLTDKIHCITYNYKVLKLFGSSGGSRIYKSGGGHKIMDACSLYDHTFVYLPTPQHGGQK